MVGEFINLSTVREDSAEDERRHRLIGKLEDLLWDDMDALFQLNDYCLNRRNKVDKRVEDLLVKMEILAEDGTLPDRTKDRKSVV